MFLVYTDDSREDPYQIVSAVILRDDAFLKVEEFMLCHVAALLPDSVREDEKFEFHAADMLAGNPPFGGLTRDKAIEIFERCATILEGAPADVVCGAVNIESLRGTVIASAKPLDMAFRYCLDGLVEWFDSHALSDDDAGILICDNSTNGTEKVLYNVFREYRPRIKSVDANCFKYDRGRLKYFHDDIYFGSSRYSIGIQFSDLCAYIIHRHLQKKKDTEFLYKMVESRVKLKVYPNE